MPFQMRVRRRVQAKLDRGELQGETRVWVRISQERWGQHEQRRHRRMALAHVDHGMETREFEAASASYRAPRNLWHKFR